MKEKQIHIYLSRESAKYLKDRAKKEKRSMSNMAVIIIEQAKEHEKI